MFTQPRPTRPTAFTLIELLVVITIMVILIGISFPFLRGMIRTSSVQIAANSLSSAVSGARAYSTRDIRFDQSVGVPSGPSTIIRSSEDDGDGYSGAAVIVTPANELRVVHNIEDAVDAAGNRLELSATLRNAYADIDSLDQIKMPGRVRMLGIVRNSALPGWDANIRLLPPPFAIVFNNRGSMLTSFGATTIRKRSDGYVYYDADGDNVYDWDNTLANDRHTRAAFVASGGTLATYRRDVVTPTSSGFNQIPFETLEPVVGVVLFEVEDLPQDVLAVYDPDAPGVIAGNGISPPAVGAGDAEIILDWASQSGTPGQVMFFNRYTGIDISR